MKKLLQIRIIILFFMILIINVSFAQHFTTAWTGNPYMPMNIIVQDAAIDELDMEAGDEIAVFDMGDDNQLICVGSIIMSEVATPTSPIIVTTGQVQEGDVIDGYTPGNDIVFKLWDSSELIEITIITPVYLEEFDTEYAPLGTAVVTSLVGNTSSCIIPDDWTFNPSDFSFNGEVNAQVFVDDIAVESGKIGAFVGDECRGIVNSSYFSPGGYYLFTIMCYYHST